MLWARAVRDWRRIREVYPVDVPQGTALHVALQVAAAQMFYGLTFVFFLSGGLIVAIGRTALKAAAR